MTRLQAFRCFGIKAFSPYRWSARSADGLKVAITIWLDELSGPAGGLIYRRLGWGDWNRVNGRFFFEDLAWAVAYCSQIVQIIIVDRDRQANSRVRTTDCYPVKWTMRVSHFDPVSGAFQLKQIVPQSEARAT